MFEPAEARDQQQVYQPGGKIPVILAHIAHAASTTHASFSLAMFQEAAATFSLTDMWSKMTWIPRGIVIILFIMSIWSLAVMIDRAIYFSAARSQSREFAPKVAGALKNGNLDEAIKVADQEVAPG
jgi:hypothetical protein